MPRVAIHFGKPQQRELENVTASELEGYRRDGHFAEGSMEPKVKAVLRFFAAGGKRAIIAHLDQAADAIAGKAGTHVVAAEVRPLRIAARRSAALRAGPATVFASFERSCYVETPRGSPRGGPGLGWDR